VAEYVTCKFKLMSKTIIEQRKQYILKTCLLEMLSLLLNIFIPTLHHIEFENLVFNV